MVAEKQEKVRIFLPYEIIEVDAIDDKLIVVANPHMEGQVYSFTLNPESVLPSVADKAKNAGLPIAQYVASKIRGAIDEQLRNDLRLNALSQAFCQKTSPSLKDKSLSATTNRVFTVFQIISWALFAAMVMFGGRAHPPSQYSVLNLHSHVAHVDEK